MIIGTIYIVWVADDFLSIFIAFLIVLGVPMAGWCGIFLCDLFMRRYPYDERALFRDPEDGEGGYGAIRWESVLLLVVATAVGWGLVIDTTGAGKGLDWLGYLLEPLGLGGRDGAGPTPTSACRRAGGRVRRLPARRPRRRTPPGARAGRRRRPRGACEHRRHRQPPSPPRLP